jgi:hypothetical protein
MKKHCLILIFTAFLSIGFISVNADAAPPSFTVATFADPSQNSSNSLFTVDFTALTLDGGWSDTKTGLTLQIPSNGHIFTNAWFDVDDVITLSPLMPSMFFYSTGSGKINFYADNTNADPLVVIEFDSGFVSPSGFGANEALVAAANVRITGSEIAGTLSQEQFSFSFANTALLSGGHRGFTSTAAFTSSAIPEPATIALLAIGILLLKRKK